MNQILFCRKLGMVLLIVFVLSGTLSTAQNTKPSSVAGGAGKVTKAKGTFDVKMTPLTAYEIATEAGLGSYAIDKVWHGDIDGTSKGQMMATQLAGDAGLYVALEKVTAKIGGRHGTFVFEHRGYMVNNVPELSVKVAPGSGTEELVGISGKLDIKIEGGKHFYEFEYTIPAK